MDVNRWNPSRGRGTATVGLLHAAEEPVDFVLKTRHQAPGILSHHTVHGGFSFGLANVTNLHRPSPARPPKNVRTPRIISRGQGDEAGGEISLREIEKHKDAEAGSCRDGPATPGAAAGGLFLMGTHCRYQRQAQCRGSGPQAWHGTDQTTSHGFGR